MGTLESPPLRVRPLTGEVFAKCEITLAQRSDRKRGPTKAEKLEKDNKLDRFKALDGIVLLKWMTPELPKIKASVPASLPRKEHIKREIPDRVEHKVTLLSLGAGGAKARLVCSSDGAR